MVNSREQSISTKTSHSKGQIDQLWAKSNVMAKRYEEPSNLDIYY